MLALLALVCAHAKLICKAALVSGGRPSRQRARKLCVLVSSAPTRSPGFGFSFSSRSRSGELLSLQVVGRRVGSSVFLARRMSTRTSRTSTGCVRAQVASPRSSDGILSGPCTEIIVFVTWHRREIRKGRVGLAARKAERDEEGTEREEDIGREQGLGTVTKTTSSRRERVEETLRAPTGRARHRERRQQAPRRRRARSPPCCCHPAATRPSSSRSPQEHGSLPNRCRSGCCRRSSCRPRRRRSTHSRWPRRRPTSRTQRPTCETARRQPSSTNRSATRPTRAGRGRRRSSR